MQTIAWWTKKAKLLHRWRLPRQLAVNKTCSHLSSMRINSLPRYCFKQEGGGGDGVSAATSPCAVLPPVDWNRKIQSPFLFS